MEILQGYEVLIALSIGGLSLKLLGIVIVYGILTNFD